jgi:hypothetical protein
MRNKELINRINEFQEEILDDNCVVKILSSNIWETKCEFILSHIHGTFKSRDYKIEIIRTSQASGSKIKCSYIYIWTDSGWEYYCHFEREDCVEKSLKLIEKKINNKSDAWSRF